MSRRKTRIETVQVSVAEMRAKALAIPDHQWPQGLGASKQEFLRECDRMEFVLRRPFWVIRKDKWERLRQGRE